MAEYTHAVIDIHSHILHGLDDGASSLDVSLAMAQLARDTGTTDIVATPHSNSAYRFQPALIASRIRELQDAIGERLKIHRGCDFHLSVQNIERAQRDPACYSVNGSSYLLVEFPDVSMIRGADQIFAQLQSVGLNPIITHPERNPYLADDLTQLQRWVEGGIFVQITAQSLLGEPFGRKVARWCDKAISMGLVHFVASDAHDMSYRPPRLDGAKTFLDRHFGEEYAELLLKVHPRAVIEGIPLDPGILLPARKRRRKWFIFGG
jgi:protein-tyrosine phosphatase